MGQFEFELKQSDTWARPKLLTNKQELKLNISHSFELNTTVLSNPNFST